MAKVKQTIQSKEVLIKEAKQQEMALKTIRKWIGYAIAASLLGASMIYIGFLSNTSHPVVGGLGIAVAIISILSAVIMNLGVRNGRRNIEKILLAAESL